MMMMTMMTMIILIILIITMFNQIIITVCRYQNYRHYLSLWLSLLLWLWLSLSQFITISLFVLRRFVDINLLITITGSYDYIMVMVCRYTVDIYP